jgi:hypothetical protein
MAKAEIKTADGTHITIEGSAAEVANVVARIRGAPSSTGRRGESKRETAKREAKRERTASDLVANLKEEGFFDKPKRLADVGQKLEESGYLYPVTTLSGVMLSLVQKRILTRKKSDGVWIYGKR